MLTHASGKRGAARCAVALLSASVMVAALSSSSCGGGGGAETKTDADGLTKLTVLRPATSVFEPLYIAQQKGWFKQNGLSVTLKVGNSDSSQNAPTLIRGDAQFAMTDGGGFLKAAAGGLPVQLVDAMQAATTKDKQSDGLVAAAKSDINDYKDLANKKVALPSLGGSLQFLCMYEAEKAGVDPKAITFVALPVNSLLDAVKTGKVDAAFTFATFYDAAKADSALRIVGGGSNDLPGELQGLLMASTPYIKANPSVVKKFSAAVRKALAYGNAHPEEIRAIDRKYTTMTAGYIKKRTIQTFTPVVNTKVLGLQSQKMKQYGLTDAAVSPGKVVWSGAKTSTSTT